MKRSAAASILLAGLLGLGGYAPVASGAPDGPANLRRSDPRRLCDASKLAGAWTNGGGEYAGWGVALAIKPGGAPGEVSGDFSKTRRPSAHGGQADWPAPMLRGFDLRGALAAGNAPEGVCNFVATGFREVGGAPVAWKGAVSWNMRTDTLRVLGLSPAESAPWTRGKPPAPGKVCARADIEGAWHRADGAEVRISGMDARGGGSGVYAVQPRTWVRGVVKYVGVRQALGCSFEATCVEISWPTGPDGDPRKTEPLCTLTLDPEKGVLTQGDRAAYSRKPATTPEAEALRRRQAALESQDADSEALNSQVNRLNAEAEARDRARDEAFARQLRDYEAKKKADAAAFARAQAEYERKKAEVEAQRLRDLADWEARVKRCQEGDKTACAPN